MKATSILNGLSGVRMLVGLVLLLGGWVGGQIVSPATRVSRLEAQDLIQDSLLAALGKRLDAATSEILHSHEAILIGIRASQRRECMKARDQRDVGNPREWLYLEAADVPCGELMGNRMAAP